MNHLEELKIWLKDNREAFIEDLSELVRIKSVSVEDEATQYPYGEGCKQVLDKALEISTNIGLSVKNYDNHCGAAFLPGETEEIIGIFSHLDVVPEGEGWTVTEPYNPIYKDGYLYGRGTCDNKSSAIMGLYLLKFMKSRGIRLKHGVLLYFGCNEEAGMKDAEHFNSKEKQPAFSLVPDGMFPLTYGEKGVLDLELTCNLSGTVLREVHGGIVRNSIPDRAYAVLQPADLDAAKAKFTGLDCAAELEGDALKVSVEGIAGHSAFPEETLNAIGKLAAVLVKSGALDEKAHTQMQMIADGLQGFTGEFFDADFKDEQSGFTSVAVTMARTEGEKLTLHINSRYVVSADPKVIAANIGAKAAQYGYTYNITNINSGYCMDKNDPVIKILTDISNRQLGVNLEPFVTRGGTYARKLARAVSFGPGRDDVPRNYNAHQTDERVYIDDVLAGVEIYLECLLAIDDVV